MSETGKDGEENRGGGLVVMPQMATLKIRQHPVHFGPNVKPRALWGLAALSHVKTRKRLSKQKHLVLDLIRDRERFNRAPGVSPAAKASASFEVLHRDLDTMQRDLDAIQRELEEEDLELGAADAGVTTPKTDLQMARTQGEDMPAIEGNPPNPQPASVGKSDTQSVVQEKTSAGSEHVDTLAVTQNVAQSRYSFSGRETLISAGAAAAFWVVIMGLSSLATHTWLWPLAVILAIGLLPAGLSGGIRRRA